MPTMARLSALLVAALLAAAAVPAALARAPPAKVGLSLLGSVPFPAAEQVRRRCTSWLSVDNCGAAEAGAHGRHPAPMLPSVLSARCLTRRAPTAAGPATQPRRPALLCSPHRLPLNHTTLP